MHRKLLSKTACSYASRRGFTLVEVTAALVLTALFAAVASRNFKATAAGTLHNEVEVHSLVAELQLVRQDAILSGEVRGIRFVGRNGRVASLQRFARDSAGAMTTIGQPVVFHSDVANVSTDRSTLEFNPEGEASGATRIRLVTEHRSWEIAVVSLTGACHVTEMQK